jgi:hypothetical protein
MDGQTEGWMDRQTDGWADRQTDRKTYRQTILIVNSYYKLTEA